MGIGTNSYGSINEVLAFTRHLLDGESTFNSTTRPTLTEVEKMIDRASAALNAGLAYAGLSVPVVQADAKLVCDDWVVAQVVNMAELTRESLGWSGDATPDAPAGLQDSAFRFARTHAPGFKRLGCAVEAAASEGLGFTGETASADRPDPEDDALRQPRFARDMFREV